MRETTIADLMEEVRHYHKHAVKWHFHMLTPQCIFNKKSGKHALILENDTEHYQLAVYSEKRLFEQGKTLLGLLHGEEVFEESEADEGESPNFEIILEKAERLNERGTPWHHHLLFPSCVFNEEKGKWCLLFEDQETGKTIKCFSLSEPKEKLKKIEALFYQQKE